MELSQAAAKFAVQLDADGRSRHTQKQYARHLAALSTWLAHEGLSARLDAIEHEHVARFLASPAARTRVDGAPKRAASVNALRSSIRSFFSYSHAAGWTRANPARLVRRARTGSAPPRGLTDAEEERLLAVLVETEQRDATLFRTLLKTGMRVGSAVGLDVADLDMVEGIATIRAKGDRRETVMIPLDVRAEIATLIGDWTSGPVFRSQRGERLSARHVQRRFAAIREEAGLSGSVSPHSLRHRFATKLLARTGDLRLVQRALTHRSVSSTAVYAAVGDERLRAAVGA